MTEGEHTERKLKFGENFTGNGNVGDLLDTHSLMTTEVDTAVLFPLGVGIGNLFFLWAEDQDEIVSRDDKMELFREHVLKVFEHFQKSEDERITFPPLNSPLRYEM